MSILRESRLTLLLAFPLMIGQLSQMLLGVADTVMVGHLGVTELAALTFASSLFHVPFVFGIGLLSGVSVLTSNCRGANDPGGARGSCRHGLYLAVLLGFLLFAISWIVSMKLEMFGQPPEVTARTQTFFRIIMASLIPALASIALKNHADALNRPWPPFWIFLGGVVLNIGLNQVMIHGEFGFPAMGLEGAAWATLIARTAILVAMMVWLTKVDDLRPWIPHAWFSTPDLRPAGKLLAIGFPASIQMACEVSAFSVAGLIMGTFGEVAMASHQIAITLAATAFMLPLGLSMALTVRMGEVYGAGDLGRMRPIAISGWALGAGYSVLAAGGFLVFGKGFAEMFIADAQVILMTGSLLVIVGIFQIFDSVQVVSSAMLRGLRDARIPAVMGFAAYWVVGLPVAAGLSVGLGQGATGVWWGLATGLMVASITLAPRLWMRTKGAKESP